MAAPRNWVLVLGVVAVVGLAYGRALEAPFFYDDHPLLEDDVVVSGSPLDAFTQSFWGRDYSSFRKTYYRPFVTASYAVDHRMWGQTAFGYHLTNLVLHLLSCVLVFLIASRSGAAPFASALGALAFGAFPRLTESVTWVSGRTDVLATVFVLGAICLHTTPNARAWHRLGGSGLLLCGLLSKEVAAAGVIALLAFEAFTRLRNRTEGMHVLPVLGALVAAVGIRIWAGASQRLDAARLASRLVFALQAVGTQVMMLADPLRPRFVIGTLGVLEPFAIGFGAVTVIAVTFGLWRLIHVKAHPTVAAGVFLALSAAFATLHLVPIAVSVVAADRFLYLPIAGLAIAGAVASTALRVALRRPASAIALVVGVLFLAATSLRNRDWHSELGLWRITLEQSPAENIEPLSGYGTALQTRERFAEALKVYERADSQNRRARELHPLVSAQWLNWQNVAQTYSGLGQQAQAANLFESLIQSQPDQPQYRVKLALVEARRLRFERAIAVLHELLALRPQDATALETLQTVEAAKANWPPQTPTPDEPTSVIEARAHVFGSLAALHEASVLYARVAAAPDVSPEQLRAAANYLALHAAPEVTERVVARLAADDVTALNATIAATRARMTE